MVFRCGDAFCHICKTSYQVTGRPHVCSLSPPAEQRFWNLLAFFDTETRQVGGVHEVNSIAISVQDRDNPDQFDMRTIYDTAMAHEMDGWREEVDFVYQTIPSRVKKPPYRKPPKNLGANPNIFAFKKKREDDAETEALEAMYGLGREAEDHHGGGGRSDAAFLSTEAVEADGSEDEESSSEEDGEDSVSGDEREQDRGEVGPTRPRRANESTERPVSNALEKFITTFLTPQFYGYTFISHNSSGFDGILLLEALLKSHIRVETVFDGGRLLQLSIPKLKINFIDSFRYDFFL